MLNKLILFLTNGIGFCLTFLKFDKKIRSHNDLRLVFYHGIGDKKSASMTYLSDEIPLSVFTSHLDYLQGKYHFLSLKAALELSESNNLPREKPVGTISFDDGLRSVYSHAYPLLKERGIPFDVFINTAVVGNKDLLWLHALNYLLTTYGPEKIAGSINKLIDSDIPQSPKDALGIERWARGNFEYFYESDIIGKLFEHYELNREEIAAKENLYLTWDNIEEMSANGVGFYSHTHRHFPLNALTKEDSVKTEIRQAYDVMKENNKNNDFISFPFGMEVDYGKKSIQHALSLGHKFIVEVGDGLNSPDRIKDKNIMSRVGLGNTGASNSELYSAIEVRPLIKTKLKSLLNRSS